MVIQNWPPSRSRWSIIQLMSSHSRRSISVNSADIMWLGADAKPSSLAKLRPSLNMHGPWLPNNALILPHGEDNALISPLISYHYFLSCRIIALQKRFTRDNGSTEIVAGKRLVCQTSWFRQWMVVTDIITTKLQRRQITTKLLSTPIKDYINFFISLAKPHTITAKTGVFPLIVYNYIYSTKPNSTYWHMDASLQNWSN